MNLCLFGGTFDPIHRGHIAVARVAARRFRLQQVLFAPAALSPLKARSKVTDFWDRYAMTALALTEADDPRFIPSDIEMAMQSGKRSGKPSYTLHTLRRLRKTMKPSDRLFFLLGIDAFAGIARWHQPEKLLRSAEFIIASRPGYDGHDLRKVLAALPPSLRPPTVRKDDRTTKHGGMILHLLPDVHEPVSATQIRAAARAASKARLRRLVPASVAEYIAKTGLYR